MEHCEIQGKSYWGRGWEGVQHFQYLVCWYIFQILIVLLSIVLVTKLKGSPICWLIRLEQRMHIYEQHKDIFLRIKAISNLAASISGPFCTVYLFLSHIGRTNTSQLN